MGVDPGAESTGRVRRDVKSLIADGDPAGVLAGGATVAAASGTAPPTTGPAADAQGQSGEKGQSGELGETGQSGVEGQSGVLGQRGESGQAG